LEKESGKKGWICHFQGKYMRFKKWIFEIITIIICFTKWAWSWPWPLWQGLIKVDSLNTWSSHPASGYLLKRNEKNTYLGFNYVIYIQVCIYTRIYMWNCLPEFSSVLKSLITWNIHVTHNWQKLEQPMYPSVHEWKNNTMKYFHIMENCSSRERN
jgi:hypothetical protein